MAEEYPGGLASTECSRGCGWFFDLSRRCSAAWGAPQAAETLKKLEKKNQRAGIGTRMDLGRRVDRRSALQDSARGTN